MEIADLVDFESQLPIQRTQTYLDSKLYDDLTQQYIKFVLLIIMPISNYILLIVDNAISNYLDLKIKQYIIIFSIFIAFLLVSLVICLKIVINMLKRVVYRSRILIKIIPTDELKNIYSMAKI